MTEQYDREGARKGPTFDDSGPNYNNLPGVKYEDHFLMFKRAGNHAAYLQKVIEYADGTVIEVGCGTGTQALAVAPYVENVVGIELDSDRVTLTRDRAHRLGGHVSVIRGDMFTLPFDSNQFSVGFNSGVFQHFPDSGINSFLTELSRVCQDYLVLSVANRSYPHDGRESRRLLRHEHWRQLLGGNDQVELIADGRYGDRTHAVFHGLRSLNARWAFRWLRDNLQRPRSWFVLAVDRNSNESSVRMH